MSEQNSRESLEKIHGQVWDTQELQRDFIVEGFSYGIVVVRRKSDNTQGTLDFTHMPRYYYDFRGA